MNVKGSKKLKDIGRECALNSTSHSVPKIFRTDNLLIKAMWLLLTVVSVGGCSYIIFLIFADYLSYDVVTKIRVVDEAEPPFPTITICNKNAIVTEAGRELFNEIEPGFESTLSSLQYEENYKSFTANYRVLTILKTNNFTTDQKLSINYPRSSFIYSCQMNFFPCDYDNFQWYFSPIYGMCYSYNTGYFFNNTRKPVPSIETLSATSSIYGLQLSLYLGIQNNKQILSTDSKSLGELSLKNLKNISFSIKSKVDNI
jgi:hypothetical protein